MKKFEIPVWDVSIHLLGSNTYLATHLSNLLVNAQISNRTIYIFFWLVVIKDYKVRHFWLLKRGRPVKSLLIVKSWTQKRLVCELETLERIDWANDEKNSTNHIAEGVQIYETIARNVSFPIHVMVIRLLSSLRLKFSRI